MIDHTGVTVTDFPRSKAFFAATLAPIGLSLQAEYPAAVTGSTDVAGFGEKRENAALEFWISRGAPGPTPVHVAFRVASRADVEAFYRAALAAGGSDNGPPGVRPQYHKDYYAAFVLDPDGHNIEAVCHNAP